MNNVSGNFIQTILALPFSRRQRRLAKARPPIGEDEFVQRVSDAGGDKEAALAIHRKLGEWICSQGFTPYPEDKLSQVYGIAEEELDEELILDVLNQLGVPPPSNEGLAAFGPVNTPLQVAQLVSFARAEFNERKMKGMAPPAG